MAVATEKPLYQGIIEDVQEQIRLGTFRPGDRLYTIDEFCRRYDVSTITANRAVKELKALGVVQTVQRKGTFVVGLPELTHDSLTIKPFQRLTLLLHSDVMTESDTFAGAIWRSIVREARKQELPVRSEMVPAVNLTGVPHMPFQPEPGDGIIVFGGRLNLFMCSLLMSPRVPAVLLDAIFTEANCVATDNLAGMKDLLVHLHQRGHRRVLLSVGNSLPANTTNESERREAFITLCPLIGLSGTTIETGKLSDVFAALESLSSPTAVLFTKDEGADQFFEAATQQGLRIPEDISLAGFDGWSSRHLLGEKLTTVIIDRQEMGRQAFHLLVNPPAQAERLPVWQRIRPELHAGETIAELQGTPS